MSSSHFSPPLLTAAPAKAHGCHLTLPSLSLDDYFLGNSKCGEGVEKIRTKHQVVNPLSNGKVSIGTRCSTELLSWFATFICVEA